MDAKEAWERDCSALAEAGRIFDTARERLDDIDRAEGLRFLTRLGRGAGRRPAPPADACHAGRVVVG
jgi:hypothetical protein